MRIRLPYILPVVLLALCETASARTGEPFWRRLYIGCEWGYVQTLYSHHHYNVVSEEGYRINEKTQGPLLYPNGTVMLSAGYDVTDHMRLSLNMGYAGIAEGRRVFPALMRLSYFMQGTRADGFFTYAGAGAGLHASSRLNREAPSLLADLGEGYRLRLNRSCCLDFLLSVKCAFDRPPIPNPDGPGYATAENIRSNFAGYYAVGFSVAVSF